MNYEIVNSFIGAPWVYRENDCWSVVRKVAKSVFNIDMPELQIPPKSSVKSNIKLFIENARKSTWNITDTPKPASVALFYSGRLPTHIGIMISKGDVLHCLGSVESSGATKIDRIKDLKAVYSRVEFYDYT